MPRKKNASLMIRQMGVGFAQKGSCDVVGVRSSGDQHLYILAAIVLGTAATARELVSCPLRVVKRRGKRGAQYRC